MLLDMPYLYCFAVQEEEEDMEYLDADEVRGSNVWCMLVYACVLYVCMCTHLCAYFWLLSKVDAQSICLV